VQQKIAQIDELIELNNKFYAGPRLSLSMGAATAQAGEALEPVQKNADRRMYEAKRAHYRKLGDAGERRGT